MAQAINCRDDAEIERLRDEYRDCKAQVNASDRLDLELRERCRIVKAKLKALLEPGESTLGGPSTPIKHEKPLAGKRIPIPISTLTDVTTPLPFELRQQRIFHYDTNAFPFRELVGAVIGADPTAFPVLHKTESGRNFKDRSRRWTRRWHEAKNDVSRRSFSNLLHKFVMEFVAPRMSESPIAYQREPTFRVQVPSHKPTGYLHCDADYHHPPAEVNWWLPLTHVWGPNTLHIESEPGKGNFTPVELEYGQVLRFYGNLCQHRTVANTSDWCRVSFDFRVLALRFHDPSWVDQLGRVCSFEVGSYYQSVDELPSNVSAMAWDARDIEDTSC